jgi:peptidoglycan/LPS O-acetylase OafA/YrhL
VLVSQTAAGSADAASEIPAVLPGLDGLRAFSILVVMISHSGLSHVVPGVFGVTVFFFVSGFLITTLLIDERRRTGTIGIRSFYIRRFLRLYPPLVVSVAATALFYGVVGTPVQWAGVVAALAYLANYAAILTPSIMKYLGGQLWSLAVEEHFYFFYPLLLLFVLPGRARTAKVIAGLCAASLAIRFYVAFAFPDIAVDYNGKATETRIDSILYGALAALIWWSYPARAFIVRYRLGLLALGLILLLGSFMWRDLLMRETLRYTVQGLALIPLVLAVTVAGWLPRVTNVLESAPARWVGRHSYSLYLWHLLAFEVAEHLLPLSAGWSVLTYAVGWIFALLTAAASYRYIEAPFFAMRKRFGSNVSRVDGIETTTQPARPSEAHRLHHR